MGGSPIPQSSSFNAGEHRFPPTSSGSKAPRTSSCLIKILSVAGPVGSANSVEPKLHRPPLLCPRNKDWPSRPVPGLWSWVSSAKKESSLASSVVSRISLCLKISGSLNSSQFSSQDSSYSKHTHTHTHTQTLLRINPNKSHFPQAS